VTKITRHTACQQKNVHTLFSVCSLRDDNVIISKPTWKMKQANSIQEYFEYFCQMSSKSIVIILSYTFSKLVRFWDTVYKLYCSWKRWEMDLLLHNIDRKCYNVYLLAVGTTATTSKWPVNGSQFLTCNALYTLTPIQYNTKEEFINVDSKAE